MQNKPRTQLIIYLTSALAAVVLFLFFTAMLRNAPQGPSDDGDIAYMSRGQPVFSAGYWGDKIDEIGMHEAYALLAEVVVDMDDYGRHLNAHQFGDALFKAKYTDGVVVCDNRFGHGCFHQFFMTALSQEGAEIAPTFEKVCIDKLGPGAESHACNHGIGHGIMTAFRWRDIGGALNVCEKFQNEDAFFACIDGVFMEYFTPTHIIAGGKVPTREVDPESPDSACLVIDPQFQPTCYSMAVSWWLTAGVSAENAGKWCGNIKNEIRHEACFKGLGYALVLATRYDKDFVVKKCEEAVSNVYERVLCRAGAFWGFSKGEEVGEVLAEEDKALCDFQEKEWCLREAGLTDRGLGISTICCPPDLKQL